MAMQNQRKRFGNAIQFSPLWRLNQRLTSTLSGPSNASAIKLIRA
jgi:hypothetical protein